jgi:hypothetical protein
MPKGLAQFKYNSVICFSNMLARSRSLKNKTPSSENLGDTQNIEKDNAPLSQSQTAFQRYQQQ